MPGKRHLPEQIIKQLREAEADLAGGLTIGQVCQKLGVNLATFYRWRQRYGDQQPAELARLRELEVENTRLRRLVAELALEKQMLQEVVKKKF